MGSLMLRRVAIFVGLIGVVLLLDGCTKCSPIWNDWGEAQKSCRS